ncbi:MAG: rhodanese-like domain-containing protein [Mariprofundus sp.]|nr:rhodanese-like domain-containing protein [Mariprofundus sp.]
MIKQRTVTLTLLMMVLALFASGCSQSETTVDGYKNTTLQHAYERWQQGATSSDPFVFLDVRTPGEFADGHVPGAINIPVQVLQERLNEVPKDKQVYLHCEAGGRSAKAAKMLLKAGIDNFENMPAGMRGWRDAGYPVQK